MRALVIGRAKGVWDEVKRAQEMCSFDQVVVINSAGCDYPGSIDHWASFHSNLFYEWVEKRRERGYFPYARLYWTTRQGRKSSLFDVRKDVRFVNCNGGSSGLIGVFAALSECDKVVLAGIPMSPEAGHYNQNGEWREAVMHRGAWTRSYDVLKDTVRSMSGWTRDELFGAPTEEWLQ